VINISVTCIFIIEGAYKQRYVNIKMALGWAYPMDRSLGSYMKNISVVYFYVYA
jgi:hypothetical protein